MKKSSKMELFLEQSDIRRDYLRLTFLLCISALCGLLFEKAPEIGVFSALFPMGYALLLLPMKRLTKHPLVIVSLCLAHLCGAVVYCGYKDREGRLRHSSNASLLCLLTALGCTGYSLYYQSRLKLVSEELKTLTDASFNITSKVKFQPELIRMIAMKFSNFGEDEAHEMLGDFARDSQMSAWKIRILDTVKEDQFAAYLRLAVLLFGVAVLIFALRRKLRLVPAVLSVLPAAYTVVKVHSEHLGTLALPILLSTLFACICSVVAFDQFGKGHDTAYDDEPEEPDPTDSDETYYT